MDQFVLAGNSRFAVHFVQRLRRGSRSIQDFSSELVYYYYVQKPKKTCAGTLGNFFQKFSKLMRLKSVPDHDWLQSSRHSAQSKLQPVVIRNAFQEHQLFFFEKVSQIVCSVVCRGAQGTPYHIAHSGKFLSHAGPFV